MQKIKELITSIQSSIVASVKLDKALHFLAGVIICGLLSISNTFLAIVATTLIAYGKEFVDDKITVGSFDHLDAIATISGGLFVTIIVLCV